MTGQQKAFLLMLIHSLPASERHDRLSSEMRNLGLSDNNLQGVVLDVENTFNHGIRKLNAKQLNSILSTFQNTFIVSDIKRRLSFFEIDEVFHDNIIQFLEDYNHANKPIDVADLDTEFKGVQVASRDDFNKVINQGWTGDWDLNPENITIKRVQVASMNETGPFPRGYYLNADIRNIQPILYDGKIRYRIFIDNPIIINTGNRNVRFIAQPVRYIY